MRKSLIAVTIAGLFSVPTAVMAQAARCGTLVFVHA